jgi:hypothetical protein
VDKVLQPGDKVLYVPCVETHWHDRDHRGDLVFEFVHHEDGPPAHATRAHQRSKKGEAIRAGAFAIIHPDSPHAELAHGLPLGRIETRDKDGVLTTSKGHKIRPHRHTKAWDAVVVRVNADGTVDLDIIHPNGYEIHHKPDREGVRAHAADLQSLLDREQAAFDANTPGLRYEIKGQSATRDDWRAWIASMIRDADDLTAVPGIKHDSGHGFHTFHFLEEA